MAPAPRSRSQRQHGTIKTVMNTKGFGFIRLDDSDDEYFFHLSGCVCPFDQLQPGTRVTFVAGSGPKGPRAEQIDLLV